MRNSHAILGLTRRSCDDLSSISRQLGRSGFGVGSVLSTPAVCSLFVQRPELSTVPHVSRVHHCCPRNEQSGVAGLGAVADPFWFYKLSQFIPVHQRPTIALAPVASQLPLPKELEDGGPAKPQLSSGLIDRDDLRHGLDRTEPCATVRIWPHRCVHL